MAEDSVKIAYFGGAACKVTTSKGKRVLIDPFITKNPACRKPLEYFYDADLMLVSHGAFDHLGDGIEIMKNSRASLICTGDVLKLAQDSGIAKDRLTSAIYGDQREFEGIRIKIMYARHVSRLEAGGQIYYGMPVGFVITTENGIRIYHTGDTSLFGDLKLIGSLYQPHVLLIGVSRYAAGAAAEMSPAEAALATQWVAPDIVVPMHYPVGSDDPLKFVEALRVVAPNVQPVMLEANKELEYHRFNVSFQG